MEIVKDKKGPSKVKKPVENKPKQLGNEELVMAAQQVFEQNKQLLSENQRLRKMEEEMNSLNFYRRLDYLLVVLRDKNLTLLSDDFKKRCAEEFEMLMTPIQAEQEDK